MTWPLVTWSLESRSESWLDPDSSTQPSGNSGEGHTAVLADSGKGLIAICCYVFNISRCTDFLKERKPCKDVTVESVQLSYWFPPEFLPEEFFFFACNLVVIFFPFLH